MNAAWQTLLGSPLVEALGWTLFHFLWQGALIAVAAWLLFGLTRGAGPQVRYYLACLLFAACMAAPVITLALLAGPAAHRDALLEQRADSWPQPDHRTSIQQSSHAGVVGAAEVSKDQDPSEAQRVSRPYPWRLLLCWGPAATDEMVCWLVPLWLFGVAAIGVRLGTAWVRVQYWRWTAAPVVDAALIRFSFQLAEEMKLARRVTLLVCDRIHVPFTLGWLRPAILVPTQLLTGLSPEGWRAILIHELAHIARYDYLVNLLQSVAEALLFYHPVVWWLSGKIREAREECCDEAVVRAGADRVVYAKALAEMAELSFASGLGLGATDGSLFCRVARLLGTTKPEPSGPRNHAAWALSLAGVGLIVLAILHSSLGRAGGTTALTPQTQTEDLKAFFANPQQAQTIWLRSDAEIRAGHLATVEEFLKAGMNPNGESEFGDSSPPLYTATCTQQPAMVDLLLKYGADPLHKTGDGDLAIWAACRRGNKEIADRLFKAGGNPNPLRYLAGMGDVAGLQALDKQQPLTKGQIHDGLLFASASGHLNAVDWLWAKASGLDGKSKDSFLEDMYNGTIQMGHLDVFKHLELLHSASKKARNQAFELAIIWAQPDFVKYLLGEGASPNAPLSYGYPPLLRTIDMSSGQKDPVETVRVLLDHGADINGSGPNGEPALISAIGTDEYNVAELLVQRGANPNLTDKTGMNAAMQAASRIRDNRLALSFLEELMDKGASVSGTNKNGATILDMVTMGCPPRPDQFDLSGEPFGVEQIQYFREAEPRVLERLIKAGADVNAATGSQMPLLNAIRGGNFVAGRFLLNHGASLTATGGPFNRTPLATLFSVDDFSRPYTEEALQFLGLLLDRGADPNERPWALSETKQRESIPDLVCLEACRFSEDIPPNRKALAVLFAHGGTFSGTKSAPDEAMLEASVVGDVARLQKALESGASIEATDGAGMTPLILSTRFANDEATRWLVDHGANIRAHSTLHDLTPLLMAVASGHIDLARLLITKGAKLTPTGRELDMAVQDNDRAMFDFLLKSGAKPGDNTLINCIIGQEDDMVRVLLDAGANPQPPPYYNNQGTVWWAATEHRAEALKMLLDHGADPTWKTNSGQTAFDAAESDPRIVTLLNEAINKKK